MSANKVFVDTSILIYEAQQWLTDYLNWEIVINDGNAVIEAIDLSETTGSDGNADEARLQC